MSRRLMLSNESGVGNRLYIFKDGSYGDWLNNAVFNGVASMSSGQGTVAPEGIDSFIDAGNLRFEFHSSNNRSSYVSFGILLPQHTATYTKLGYTVESKAVSRWPYLYVGMSEQLTANTGSTRFAGLGNNDMIRVNYAGQEEIEISLEKSYQNYVVFDWNAYGANTAYVIISEIWIE